MQHEAGKKRPFQKTEIKLVKTLNVLLAALPFMACWLGYYAGYLDVHFSMRVRVLLPVLFIVLYFSLGKSHEAFLISYRRISELFFTQLLILLMTDACLFIILWAMMASFPNMLPALGALALQVLFSYLWCNCAHTWYFKRFSPMRTAIIYDEQDRMEKLIDAYGLGKKFEIVKVMHAGECIRDFTCLDGLQTVFLSGVHSHERNIIIKQCVAKNVTAFVLPRLGDVIMSGAQRVHMFHLPMFRLNRYSPSQGYLFAKRAADILIAAGALALLSPLMGVIAVLIKRDGGPVFYSQNRLTQNGKVFSC